MLDLNNEITETAKIKYLDWVSGDTFLDKKKDIREEVSPV